MRSRRSIHALRCACQEGASASPSCIATRWRTAGPLAPSASSAPTGPPSCTARPVDCASPRRSRSCARATAQRAIFRPAVIGSAGCSSVRPSIGVARCSCARRASERTVASRARSVSSRHVRRQSAIAVSSTSWLVAPKCTCFAAAADARRATSSQHRDQGHREGGRVLALGHERGDVDFDARSTRRRWRWRCRRGSRPRRPAPRRARPRTRASPRRRPARRMPFRRRAGRACVRRGCRPSP